MAKDGYYCKECGMVVIVTKEGKIIRACKCTGTIIAGMRATAKGISEVKQKGGIQQPQTTC